MNRAYLQFFLPFWTEHILGHGPLEPADLKAAVEELLKPSPPPAYVPPPAYIPPAVPPPPPMPFMLPPPPTPGPYNFFQHHVPYGPPPGLLPPPTAPRPPGAAPPGNTPQNGQQRLPHSGFLGKPISPLICGKNVGIDVHDTSRLCACTISRAFPGRIHYPFECPFKYHAQRGSCPGWTSNGTRIPAAWAGEDITPATQAEWRTMVPSLPVARAAGGQEAQF